MKKRQKSAKLTRRTKGLLALFLVVALTAGFVPLLDLSVNAEECLTCDGTGERIIYACEDHGEHKSLSPDTCTVAACSGIIVSDSDVWNKCSMCARSGEAAAEVIMQVDCDCGSDECPGYAEESIANSKYFGPVGSDCPGNLAGCGKTLVDTGDRTPCEACDGTGFIEIPDDLCDGSCGDCIEEGLRRGFALDLPECQCEGEECTCIVDCSDCENCLPDDMLMMSSFTDISPMSSDWYSFGNLWDTFGLGQSEWIEVYGVNIYIESDGEFDGKFGYQTELGDVDIFDEIKGDLNEWANGTPVNVVVLESGNLYLITHLGTTPYFTGASGYAQFFTNTWSTSKFDVVGIELLDASGDVLTSSGDIPDSGNNNCINLVNSPITKNFNAPSSFTVVEEFSLTALGANASNYSQLEYDIVVNKSTGPIDNSGAWGVLQFVFSSGPEWWESDKVTDVYNILPVNPTTFNDTIKEANYSNGRLVIQLGNASDVPAITSVIINSMIIKSATCSGCNICNATPACTHSSWTATGAPAGKHICADGCGATQDCTSFSAGTSGKHNCTVCSKAYDCGSWTINDTYHICGDCNQSYEHTFNANDICTVCDKAKPGSPCENGHDMVPVDDSTHKCSRNCGVQGNHTIGSDFKCNVCGYVHPCANGHLYTPAGSDGGRWGHNCGRNCGYLNWEDHDFNNLVCTKCGYDGLAKCAQGNHLFTSLNEWGHNCGRHCGGLDWENHIIVNFQCTKCGYKQACADGHLIQYYNEYGHNCARNCGGLDFESHNYVNGRCTGCGHVLGTTTDDCANGHLIRFLNEDGHHCARNCGGLDFEPHNFVNDVCTACGYNRITGEAPEDGIQENIDSDSDGDADEVREPGSMINEAEAIDEEFITNLLEQAIAAGDKPVFILADIIAETGGTMLTSDMLLLIREMGVDVEVILPSGYKYTIIASSIGSNVGDFDLLIDIYMTDSETSVSGQDFPTGSIVIKPNFVGHFGFDIKLHITAAQLADAGIDADNVNLFHIDHENKVTFIGALNLNADGSVDFTISHASYYKLSAATPVTVSSSGSAGNNTGLIIGIVAAIVLVIAGGVTLVIVMKKRKA